MLKNILITGGAGYIGSHTATAFLNKGYGVVAVDDLSTGYLEAVPEGAGFVKTNIHNIREMVDIIKKNNIDGIVHFAAKTNAAESFAQPLEYYSNNTGGVMSILHACQLTGVRKIVFSSTAAVYGHAGSKLITEDFPFRAIDPYGVSNYFSECIMRDCGKAYGINNVILRYFNASGAAQDRSNGSRSKVSSNLIKLAAQTALGVNPYLRIHGTDLIRDYIHVEDLADLHTLAFEYLENGGTSDIFNCGYGHGYPDSVVLDAMKKVTGMNFNIDETGSIPGEEATLVVGIEKIQKSFNWTPQRDNLELICQNAFEWESVWQKRLQEFNQKKQFVKEKFNENEYQT